MEAIYRHGTPLMVDHTPSGAVSAGDVVVVGSEPRIAHSDIAAGELGALSAGGGVYDVAKDDSVIVNGARLFWDDAEGNVTTDPSGNQIFGRAAAAAATGVARVLAIHDPAINAS